jgi:hypothetical protein
MILKYFKLLNEIQAIWNKWTKLRTEYIKSGSFLFNVIGVSMLLNLAPRSSQKVSKSLYEINITCHRHLRKKPTE